MGALFTISYWVTLVTVIPGLVTLAVVWGAFAVVHPELLTTFGSLLQESSEWFGLALAVTAMVLTQALGIVLEELLVRNGWLGRGPSTEGAVDSYAEYSHLYPTLARLREQDDTHGHLRRTVAQLFLTLNTLVSFTLALMASVFAYLQAPGQERLGSMLAYAAAMLTCLVVSYVVAVIRFREMGRSVATVRAALADQ